MSVLRIRDVRLIVSAVGVSAVGDAALWILLALYVGATGPPLAVSVALPLPVGARSSLLGGVAGRLVDRHENRRLLILVSLGQAAVVAAMALSLGSLPVLLGLLRAARRRRRDQLARRVRARPRRRRRGARRRRQQPRRGRARRPARSADPLRSAAGSPPPAWTELGLLIDAASFAAVALAAVALRARRAPAGGARHRARARRARRPCSATAPSRSRWAASIAALLCFTISVAAEVFFVADVLHAGPAVYGVLMTGWTLGMVGGAVGLARRVPRSALAPARAGLCRGAGRRAAGRRPRRDVPALAARLRLQAASPTAQRTCSCGP